MHSDPHISKRSVLAAIGSAALQGGPSAAARLLEKTERWSPEQLLPHQLWRLQDVLQYARRYVPFYRVRKAYGLAGELNLEGLRSLPILTRGDVLEQANALRSEEPEQEARRWGRWVAREANSSGSTGRHVTVQVDQTSAAFISAIAERDHAWHQRETDLHAAAIRAVPSGAALRGAGLTWSAAGGRLSVLEVHTPIREQLAWLMQRRPAYVSTYGSNAAALLAEAERGSLAWPELRELGTFGELIPGHLRAAATRVWGVPLVDAYSCVELGYMALQCPEQAHYHAQAEHVFVEVLREDGSACEPGETGRVVVSALHGFVMPLIRYDVGDFATVGERCACGRGLPVLTQVVGRVRNLLRLRPALAADPPDVLWPRYASNLLGGCFGLRQFRLVQLDYEVFELQLVASALGAEAEEALRGMIVETLGHHLAAPPKLVFRYTTSIPRGANGKFEDFVCEMPAPE